MNLLHANIDIHIRILIGEIPKDRIKWIEKLQSHCANMTFSDNSGDRVQDSYEDPEFWMTRLDWVGIQLKQFEIFEEHENCLSRWKQYCSSWKSVEWKPCINRESNSLELTI